MPHPAPEARLTRNAICNPVPAFIRLPDHGMMPPNFVERLFRSTNLSVAPARSMSWASRVPAAEVFRHPSAQPWSWAPVPPVRRRHVVRLRAEPSTNSLGRCYAVWVTESTHDASCRRSSIPRRRVIVGITCSGAESCTQRTANERNGTHAMNARHVTERSAQWRGILHRARKRFGMSSRPNMSRKCTAVVGLSHRFQQEWSNTHASPEESE